MKNLVFVTGNTEKFETAKHACSKHGIELVQNKIEIDEIQAEDPKKVALDKASKAFKNIGRPVIITDDSWWFSGLHGFPGVYMHSMNTWLSPADFLRLTLPLKDRKVTLTQYLVYDEGDQQQIFTQQTRGELLKEIKGSSSHSSHTIITLEGDGGMSIAEAYEKTADKSSRQSAQIWHDFANWVNSHN